jgi:hypothetical protein
LVRPPVAVASRTWLPILPVDAAPLRGHPRPSSTRLPAGMSGCDSRYSARPPTALPTRLFAGTGRCGSPARLPATFLDEVARGDCRKRVPDEVARKERQTGGRIFCDLRCGTVPGKEQWDQRVCAGKVGLVRKN